MPNTGPNITSAHLNAWLARLNDAIQPAIEAASPETLKAFDETWRRHKEVCDRLAPPEPS